MTNASIPVAPRARRLLHRLRWQGRRHGRLLAGGYLVALALVASLLLGVFGRGGPNLPATVDSQALGAAWAAGQVIVLVRHEERCDRSKQACLGPADGITERGQAQAVRLGEAYSSLGLSQSTVVHSPATRTAQTANATFGERSQAREWAADCTPAWFEELGAHKAPGQNLVVVTHSECMGHTLDALDLSGDVSYGSSLFLTVAADGGVQPLALVAAPAWASQAR